MKKVSTKRKVGWSTDKLQIWENAAGLSQTSSGEQEVNKEESRGDLIDADEEQNQKMGANVECSKLFNEKYDPFEDDNVLPSKRLFPSPCLPTRKALGDFEHPPTAKRRKSPTSTSAPESHKQGGINGHFVKAERIAEKDMFDWSKEYNEQQVKHHLNTQNTN